MSEPEKIVVTRTVDAPAERLFALLADPARHVEFDETGFIRTIADGGPITAIGDRFVMDMENERLGTYQMQNTVIAFEPDRVIGWAPELYPLDGYRDRIGDLLGTGHVYLWELEPTADGGTRVTQTYDWSGVADPAFRARFPRLDADQLGASIERAAAVAAR